MNIGFIQIQKWPFIILKRKMCIVSGYGKCGVAVIRVSGPDAADVMKQLGSFKLLPEARKSVLRRIRDPSTNEVLDRGLVLWFPGSVNY